MTSDLRGAAGDAHERVLARRGHDGYRQYRIPALAVTTRGTVLAAYDGRPNLDDLPSPIDLLVRRSADSGRTWGPQQVVRTGEGLEGFGDPSLLVDATTGRIFCFHAAGTHAGFFEAVEGLEPADDVQHVDVSVSDDDGLTWHHRRLTDQLKRPGVTGIFAAAGQGVQIHTGPWAGRLVQQLVLLEDGVITAASALSDDHGATWRVGASVGAGTNENKVVARDDGTLLLHSRATPHRLVAVSTDGGETWGEPRPDLALVDPSDNGSVVRADGLPTVAHLATPETSTWLVATHNLDPDLRRNTVVRLSRDDGATWPHTLVVHAGSSAYSTAARLPDGRLGVLYERDGYSEIVFTTVDLHELAAAGPAPVGPDPSSVADARGTSLEVVLRSVTPARPSVWRTTGTTHTLHAADAAWDPSVRKEVGQGYSADAPQVLSDRASQDLNYGPVTPGLRAGDLLALHGRVTAPSGTAVHAVVRRDDEIVLGPAELAPGARGTFTSTWTVTAAHVAAGEARTTLTLTTGVDGQVASAASSTAAGASEEVSLTLVADTTTGAVRPA